MAPLLTTSRKEAEALSQGRHSITLENIANLDLLGSPKDLRSALSNRMSNAVRNRPTGGRITTRWEHAGQDSTFTCGFGRERLLPP